MDGAGKGATNMRNRVVEMMVGRDCLYFGVGFLKPAEVLLFMSVE